MEIKDFIINVKTQEEYNKLIQLLENNDYEWRDDGKPTKYNYFNSDDTCIRLQEEKKVITYGDYIDYFSTESYAIISFDYFMRNTNLKYRKKMTLKEIEKRLGYAIKIVEEEE